MYFDKQTGAPHEKNDVKILEKERKMNFDQQKV
jgi:hypothetical protein